LGASGTPVKHDYLKEPLSILLSNFPYLYFKDLNDRQKKMIFIPLVLISAFLIYCWAIILTTEIIAARRPHLGLMFFTTFEFDNETISTTDMQLLS